MLNSKILIVGGGPAGLAATIALAHAGVSSLVIEKGCWPLDKVCGEGLMPTGVQFLQRFSIASRLTRDMFRPFRGIRYLDPQGVVAEADFASGSGWGIRRTALSSALLATAKALSAVELRPWTCLMHYRIADEGCYVHIQDMKTKKFQEIGPFPVMVGADGLRSRIRKLAGLEGPPPGKQKRWGTRQHFAVAPWSDHVEVWWQQGIEAYVTPSAANRVEIAFIWDRNLVHPNSKQLFASLIALFPKLRERLQDAVPLNEIRSIGPLAVAAQTPVDNRVVLIGDAFVYLDGITGEGLSISFAQAEILARYLPEIHNGFTRYSLAPLAQALQEKTYPQLTMTRLALFLTRHPTLRKFALRGLSRSPRCFQHFLEANMGTRKLWNFPWQSPFELAYGFITPRKNFLL